MSTIDVIIVVAFLCIITGVGVYFRKWMECPDDFHLAGRQLTPFILAGVLTGIHVSLYSFIGQNGGAYLVR